MRRCWLDEIKAEVVPVLELLEVAILSCRNEGLERLGFLEGFKERRFRVKEREFGECFSSEHNRRERERENAWA